MLIVRLEKYPGGDKFMQGGLMAKRNNFEDFLNKTENATQGGKYNFYIKNELIVSRSLQNDIVKPSFITKILRNRLTGLTIWPNFVRKPEMKDRERYYCVVQGREEFRLV